MEQRDMETGTAVNDPIGQPAIGPTTQPNEGRHRWLPWAAWVGLIVLAGVWAYILFGRSWIQRWGATDAEVAATLAGDDVVSNPPMQTTRAITINAPAGAIWPWLAQIGQAHGGLYSYEWLENLIGCQMTNADRIHPEWQAIAAGDTVGMYPPGSGPPPYRVVAVQPNEALILGHTRGLVEPGPGVTWNDTWAFILRPMDAGHTRLIIRTRTFGWGGDALIEPGVFVMERGMLYGIKERAERLAGAEPAGNADGPR